MPALANLAKISSTGMDPVSLIFPWSARAFNVSSGIVFTVKGAARASTYRMSEAFGLLGSGAGEEEALGTGAGVEDTLPAGRIEQNAVLLEGLPGYGDAELVVQRFGHFIRHCYIPAADEQRGDGTDIRVQPGSDAALDAAQVSLGRLDILRA